MTPEERFERIETTLEKHNDAIRGLIVVSRTCLDSIQELRDGVKELRDSVKELREAQAATDEKLNILIDTVDRVIRHRNGNP
jgi:uncharacterized coiled-coil DUF342 family protein